MQTKTSKERFFSIELHSKSNIKNLNMTNGNQENVLIEGTIGELVHAGFNEEIILEVVGKSGVLRLELSESDIKKIAEAEKLPQKSKTAID